MQLGMIGLGRMGGNIVRRSCCTVIETVVLTATRSSERRTAGEGAVAAPVSPTSSPSCERPRLSG